MLQELRRSYKRLVAFMLTIAMTFTNIGTNLSVAFAAGETEDALFLLSGEELQSAIQDAVENGEKFNFRFLELTARSTSLKNSYQKLLGTKSGAVYALDVEIDDSYAPEGTSAEAFYNAGTKDVVFLFINESDMVVTFRANVDGYETSPVTINPNAANVEDEEDADFTEDYSNAVMIDDMPKTLGATVIPSQDEAETEAAENVDSEAAIGEDTDETEAAESADGDLELDIEETDADNGEAGDADLEETESEDKTVEAVEAETVEAEMEEAAGTEDIEAENAEEELENDAADMAAAVSFHPVSRVATSVEVLEAAETEEAEEIETVGDEAEAAVDETESEEETVVEETEVEDETAVDETEDAEAADEAEAEEEVIAAETKADTEAASSSNADRDEVLDDDEGQMLIGDDVEVLGELKGKSFNTVTLWGSANARAYRVSLKDLEGAAAVGSYTVDYTVDPVGAADIRGAASVAAGADLYFGVTPQVGYKLVSVTANGEELEAVEKADLASASEAADCEYIYIVETVTEDLEIVAELTEVGAHPSFEKKVTINGVTITASAEEGIIPEGTELSVEEVTEQVAEAVKENLENHADGKKVKDVLVYDINLMLNGKKLNNTWDAGGEHYVTVAFTGNRIQKLSEQADEVLISTLETPTRTVDAALGGTEEVMVIEQITSENITVNEDEAEIVDVSGNASVDAVTFDATHFTPIAVAAFSDVFTLESIYVLSDHSAIDVGSTAHVSAVIAPAEADQSVTWSSSDETVATVDKNGVVTGVKPGVAVITAEAEADPMFTASTTITVNTRTVSSVAIHGYEAEYLLAGSQVQLSAELTPADLNVGVVWSSSNKAVAAVDTNGKVTAVGQGYATIKAEAADASHAYAEQEIVVYNSRPVKQTVQVWVTNQYQNTDYEFYLPSDGTIVPVDKVFKEVEGFETTGKIRVGNWASGGSTLWSEIESVSTVTAFRYYAGRIQYTTDNNTWNNVDSNKIIDFCQQVYKPEVNIEGIKVFVGDWPYSDGVLEKHTNKTIRIQLYNADDNDSNLADLGQMRYDNTTARALGKVIFNVDESRYYVDHVIVSCNNEKKEDINAKMDDVANYGSYNGEAISANFSTKQYEHFFIKAYVKEKNFTLSYDANGGTGNVPESYSGHADSVAVIASGAGLTKENYIFGGWQYNGKTYREGDRFTMPIGNVEMTALWVPMGAAIKYEASPANGGTVTPAYEMVTSTMDAANLTGSMAKSNVGYQFVGWIDASGATVKSVSFKPVTTQAATYTAVFEPIAITATAGNYVGTYDGQEHGVTVTVKGLPEGYTYSASSNAKATNVTKESITATCDSLTIYDEKGKDVTSAFTNIKKVDGTIKINPVIIKLQAASDEKEYDGTALTADGYVIETGAFVKGEGLASVTVEGSRTIIGESVNTIKDHTLQQGTWAINYDISYLEGTLKVTAPAKAFPVTVTANSDSKTYNGSEQTVTGIKSITGLLNGHRLSGLTATGSGTNADEYDVEITGEEVILDENGNDVTSYYAVEKVSGTLTITPAELVIKTPDAAKTYDGKALTKKGTITGLIKGDAVFETTGTQTLVGSSKNTYKLTWKNGTVSANYTITEDLGTLTVTAGTEIDPVDPDKVVVKTHGDKENGAAYGLGDTVTFTITVTNIYDETKDITITEQKNVTLDQSVFNDVPAGQTRTITATYKITKEDILAGSFTNKVTVTFSGETDEFSNTDEVKLEDAEGKLQIEKTVVSTPSNAEKGVYQLGETIRYEIKATNKGNVTLTGVVVTDPLTGLNETISTLEPNGSKTFETEHKVTEADIQKGSVANTATGYAHSPLSEDPETPDVEGEAEVTVPTEAYGPSLFVDKTAKENGKDTYALGETITYDIYVKNNGNATIKNIIVKDDLTGDEEKIGSLAPGGEKTITVTYTVLEKDILAGEIINKATVTGKDPEDKSVNSEDTEVVTTDPKSTKLSAEKKITNEGFEEGVTKFHIGDTIHYEITVTNKGNVTQKNIPVEDVMTGNGTVQIDKDGWFGTNLFAGEYTVDGTTITVKELAPNESATICCSYKVVKEDNGTTVINQVIAGNDEEDDDAKDEVPAEIEQTYDIFVKHEFADGISDNDVKLPENYTVENKLPGYSEKFTADEVKGYAASPAVYDVVVEDHDITITFVYYKDAIGTDPEHPDQPDGIPDVYQITFTYISEDEARGTVTGTVKEVHNRYEMKLDEDGRIVEVHLDQVKPVTPKAEVTQTPADGYRFAGWTADQASAQDAATAFADAEAIRSASFYTDTVFTASFETAGNNDDGKDDDQNGGDDNEGDNNGDDGNGDNNGDDGNGDNNGDDGNGDNNGGDGNGGNNGNGGDSSSGSNGGGSDGGSSNGSGGSDGGSSSTSRSSRSGGTGSTTTISEPAVPLASMPELPTLEIKEEDVPLAALPKTGRTSTNLLVMFLSGMMFAALAAAGRKKEDEQ